MVESQACRRRQRLSSLPWSPKTLDHHGRSAAQRVHEVFTAGRPPCRPICILKAQPRLHARTRQSAGLAKREQTRAELAALTLKPSCGHSTEHHPCITEDSLSEEPTANRCSLTNQVLGMNPQLKCHVAPQLVSLVRSGQVSPWTVESLRQGPGFSSHTPGGCPPSRTGTPRLLSQEPALHKEADAQMRRCTQSPSPPPPSVPTSRQNQEAGTQGG